MSLLLSLFRLSTIPSSVLFLSVTAGGYLLYNHQASQVLPQPLDRGSFPGDTLFTGSRLVRAIVFMPPKNEGDERLRPLHLDMHGGGFIGGLAEYNARWCARLSDETGAVVVSSMYRYAPNYTFPAAIDDIDDVVEYLFKNAEAKFGANPELFTVSGSSAGGNLALAACQQPACQYPSKTAVKASVAFYALIDLRLQLIEKLIPLGFLTKDPLWFLLPLFDTYPAPLRASNLENPRMNPIIADIKTLPDDMLLIIPTIDILLHEQLAFVERVKADIEAEGDESRPRRVEGMVFEDCFHGWLELPSFVIKEKSRTDAFDAGCKFIKEAHKKHGFDLAAV